MFEFDLQRFDDDNATTAESADVPQQEGEEEPLPEELSGLPEDIARETFAEWKVSHPAEDTQGVQDASKPQTEESVPYARFKEKVDEANQLKAQLAEYQRRMQQQPAVQPPPQPQQQQQPTQTQTRITPEVAQKINTAIHAEAVRMSGLTQKEIEDLEFADDDDPKLIQWNQSKAVAQNYVFNAIRQAQAEQRQQAQQFFATHQSAVQAYNEFVQKEMATEKDMPAIQNFAANEFFESLPPAEKRVLADSYLRVERQLASPAEILVVQNYYKAAKAAFRARANSAKKPAQTPAQRSQQAAKLPRSDQLKGGAENTGGQLTASEIEKLLQGDFTKIDPKKQKIMLGLT